MKLYKVTIRGGFNPTATNYNVSYVVANDSTSAYKLVRAFLDKKDLCFEDEREMKTVELLADTAEYGSCRTLLFITKP